MAKDIAKWDFQKDGKPFDELPSVVKRNPKFLYEYIRTGELPKFDKNIQEKFNRDIKYAKRDIWRANKLIPMLEERFVNHANDQELKTKECLDKYFNIIIEEGLLSNDDEEIEREVYDLGIYYTGRPILLKETYRDILKLKNKRQKAENKLKELIEYDSI